MKFTTLAPDFVAAIRAGGPDANGQPAETATSDGVGVPCRCCLRNVPAGEAYLICAARPFPTLQPYAETGPIFLCQADCTPWSEEGVPPILTTSPDYLIKGYTADHRIRYGTGAVVGARDLTTEIEKRLADPVLAFVDVRSARNNCFQARAIRAGDKLLDIR